MNNIVRTVATIVIFSLALTRGLNVYAQGLLDKTISVEIRKKHVAEALDAIAKQGHFYFSYNSLIINKDSIVSLSIHSKTVRQTLDMLLGDGYQYKDIDNHIVIQPLEKEKWYTVSGYITDAATGQKVADASVFERQQLVATLSDPAGYFRLRLKDRERFAAPQIVVSKGFYIDTSITVDRGFDQEISLAIAPAAQHLPDIVITQYSRVEQTWFGKFLFSKKLRKQSANLEKFFTDKPMQFSLTPGLGTHGKMSSQVTNTFSFNLLGGYSAGVNGFEVGSLFNIDKKDVQYAQVAGVFNIVSGNVSGVQLGGVMNKVSRSVRGVQVSGVAGQVGDSVEGVMISGVSSYVGGSMSGVQISGIANLVTNRDMKHSQADTIPEAMHGAQVAGIVNVVNGHSRGVQLAGVANLNRGDLHGVQMSGVINVAKRVEGSQISIINIADTVTGYCFGILNIVKHGYHVLSISSNEMLNVNAVYKAGGSRLYSILGAGMSAGSPKQLYALTYGIGKEIPLGKKLFIATEVTAQHMYPTSNELNIVIVRAEPTLNFRLHKMLSVYAGPAIAFCPATQGIITEYFPTSVPADALYNIYTGVATATWVGWKAGINIF